MNSTDGVLSGKDIKTFAEVLMAYEKRSTCARVQVASIIVKHARCIMEGWNGVPPGFSHCNEHFHEDDVQSEAGRESHRQFSERFEHHAEANAIGQCARDGISTNGCTIVQTVSPCMQCAKLITIAGIQSVYYLRDYDRGAKDAISYLILNGIKVFKIDYDVVENRVFCLWPKTLLDTYTPMTVNGTVYNPKG